MSTFLLTYPATRWVLVAMAVARAALSVAWNDAHRRARLLLIGAPAPHCPRIVGIRAAGDDADVVEFECARHKRWLAFVAPGMRFDLDACAARTGAARGPSAVLLATSEDAAGRREDVTDTLAMFCGPRGDYHGLGAPRLREISEFLAPRNAAARAAKLTVMLSSMEVRRFGADDALEVA